MFSRVTLLSTRRLGTGQLSERRGAAVFMVKNQSFAIVGMASLKMGSLGPTDRLLLISTGMCGEGSTLPKVGHRRTPPSLHKGNCTSCGSNPGAYTLGLVLGRITTEYQDIASMFPSTPQTPRRCTPMVQYPTRQSEQHTASCVGYEDADAELLHVLALYLTH